MLDNDVKMLERHFLHSLEANGDLLAAWHRIKKKYVEAQNTSTNTGSPKLPTLAECERWYVKEKCAFEHITELEKNVIRDVYDFICRQLRAGA